MTSSLYIHIPFCSNICTYCNFTKFFYNENLVYEYLKALEKEINQRYKQEIIKTIYIGGGTPSSLTLKELEYLFKILKQIKKSKNLEFTIEVNPDSLTKEKLLLFKKNGVNRISMGVESTIPKYLKFLGRNHDFELVKKQIALIKEMGFSNINVDLIYALPNETLEDLKLDLNNILSLEVTHISTYSLMIEEHTKLYIDKVKNIDEDLDFSMYDLICKTLTKHGFIHYEVSNFKKPNFESKHNLVYWNNEHYYGFGLSAASYIENERITNTNSLSKYLKGNYIKEVEKLSFKDTLSYALILGFRKIEGISKEDFYNRYKVELTSLYNIKDLLKMKKLIDNGRKISICYDKIYIENDILINFVGE